MVSRKGMSSKKKEFQPDLRLTASYSQLVKLLKNFGHLERKRRRKDPSTEDVYMKSLKEGLLQDLEARLDRVLLRSCLFANGGERNQEICAGRVTVNGKVVRQRSYECKPGDIIRCLGDTGRSVEPFKEIAEMRHLTIPMKVSHLEVCFESKSVIYLFPAEVIIL